MLADNLSSEAFSQHENAIPVWVRTTNGEVLVPALKVFFAFGSGRLDYDCVSCGAQCCRGHGYALGREEEVSAQLTSQPALGLFFEEPLDGPPGRIVVRNCEPSCFFLNGAGRCRIHLMHGFAAKPETCRLFPFNNLLLAGEHLVVAPHLSLCPLKVVSPSARSDLSDHGILLAQMSSHGIHGRISEAESDPAHIELTVRTERRLIDLSELYMSDGTYTRFAAAQLLTARTGDPSAATAQAGDVEAEIRQYRAQVCEVLGVPLPPAEDFGLAALFAALTPVVRSQFAFGWAGQAREGLILRSEQLPRLLIVLHLFASFAKQAGMEAITFQTVMQLLRRNKDLMVLLAHLNSTVCWCRAETIDAPVRATADYERAYLRIVKALQVSSGPDLYTLLCANLSARGHERLMCVKALAKQLARKVTICGTANGRKRTLRARLQQWVHGHVNEKAMTDVTKWRRDRPNRRF
jgi:hypothetical protein